ncbi:ABC transporter substrate-binding protein [Oceanibacterium hippocampi]|uniref:ABC transporter substrate binding protein n=1 Tax=Oceanibacterium hippocampi TaxID=745714 RepID=A0A1Y5SHF3_9PROT|nr:ABC transporter substrate-binding protein [Oceanibacterium hippocampi]SLN40914.1 ABC transporter substrate binding protein [Oceanibacterium hippocampi]
MTKSKLLGLLAGGIASLAVAGLPAAAGAADKSVAITAIVEHPALDAARQGILDELAAQGFKEGENLTVSFQTAQGEFPTAVQIAKKYLGEKPDVIIGISTPSAQAIAANAGPEQKIVFTAVTDPVGAKLVSNNEKPGANITGMSDMSPISKHLELITRITPAAKRIGIIYNSGEANSRSLVELLKSAAPTYGMTIVEGVATNSNEVRPAARSLAGKVDAIYVPTDNTAVSAFESILQVGYDGQIPVYSGDTDSVARGAVAALGFNYYDVGRQTGVIVAKVLNGANPGDIAVEQVQKLELHINPASAAKMGVTIPDAIKAEAFKTIE